MRRQDRSISELVGLCHGIIADGRVEQSEAEYLKKWLSMNRNVLHEWPGNVIADRVFDFLEDGILDQDEQKELFGILAGVVGGDAPVAAAEEVVSTTLPFDSPLPKITFRHRRFCMTGKFALGSRKQVCREVSGLGGIVHPSVVLDLDYLVVGEFGSRDWIQSPYGRKIEKAIEYRENGHGVSIIPEKDFAEALIGYV
jgi:NAD-dependent DNA ligase